MQISKLSAGIGAQKSLNIEKNDAKIQKEFSASGYEKYSSIFSKGATSFGKVITTTCKHPMVKGDKIAERANYFNANYAQQIFDEMTPEQQENAKERSQNLWAYALAAGKGTRLADTASAFGQVVPKNPALQDLNKTLMPFAEINNNGSKNHLTFLDLQLAKLVPYMDGGSDNIRVINNQEPSGSFGDIVSDMRALRAEGKPLPNIMLWGCDNVTTVDSNEIAEYFDVAFDSGASVALVGTAVPKEKVINSLGVMKTIPNEDGFDGTVTGFFEKPSKELVEEFVFDNKGNCIANTCICGFSSEALNKLLDKLDENPDILSRSKGEAYDFATAAKVLCEDGDKCTTKVLPKGSWIDTGNMTTTQEFYSRLPEFTNALPKDVAKEANDWMKSHYKYDEKTNRGYISLGDKNIKEMMTAMINNKYPTKTIIMDDGNSRFTLIGDAQ